MSDCPFPWEGTFHGGTTFPRRNGFAHRDVLPCIPKKHDPSLCARSCAAQVSACPGQKAIPPQVLLYLECPRWSLAC